ncbi:hypothetical protein VB618_15475 [Microvirga sp. CF3062]|nr:hypothetical protein [Microvirga sp. CF3062]MEE1657606.1 hypothetical protein [Microvirga sp. CF3062]
MSQINDPAVRADKRPHHVPVIPTFLVVADTAAVRVGEAKFQFVEMKEALHHSRWIRAVRRWINVDVMNWAIRPAVRRSRDQFTELSP